VRAGKHSGNPTTAAHETFPVWSFVRIGESKIYERSVNFVDERRSGQVQRAAREPNSEKYSRPSDVVALTK